MEDKNIKEVVTIAEGDKPEMIDIHEGPTQPEERVQFNDKLEEITEEAEESDEIMPDESSGFFLRNSRKYMNLALKEAKKAYSKGEVPVGAVLLINDKIYLDHNRREKTHDITSHAEINVIRKASKDLGTWHLDNAELYVTCEPCPMCMGAILQSGIGKLVYGTTEPKTGAVESKVNLPDVYNSRIEIISGVFKEEARELLREFFVKKR